jgi:tagatose-6-phosphate ketose/aldose isomerase
MPSLLTLNEVFLQEKSAYWTAKEVSQQPNCWRDTLVLLAGQSQMLQAWLNPILAQPNLNIILTGAGTSAYVGNASVGHLNQYTDYNFQATSTTELVACPEQYLKPNQPCLLISFARSGNSPESVAAINIASQYIQKCSHLFITCNPDGELHQQSLKSSIITSKNTSINNDQYYSLLMPSQTLDKSFAMTSSFTSMLVAVLSVFTPAPDQLEEIASETEKMLNDQNISYYHRLAEKDYDRIVFLGAGCLSGFAQEASLKCLELTAGKVTCSFESPLGFRHGPKSLVNNKTLIVLLSSGNSYTRLYDTDLLNELYTDNKALHIETLIAENYQLDDVWLGLKYIVASQLIAFFKSLQLGLTPDNPCPTGEVNRVVQGVTIYPYITDNNK